jgi:hypothetical protein
MQRGLAWVSYVHDVFAQETHGEASRRRRDLCLVLLCRRVSPPEGAPIPPAAPRAVPNPRQQTIRHAVGTGPAHPWIWPLPDQGRVNPAGSCGDSC